MDFIHKNFGAIQRLYQFSKNITIKDAQNLLKITKIQKFDKKEILVQEGSKQKKVFYIKKGLIRCYHINDKGDEKTVRLIPEHRIVANAYMILFEQPSKYYYEALEPTEVFYSDFEFIDEIVTRNPKLESNRKYILRKVLKESFLRVESFVLYNPEERYLQYIEQYPEMINRVPNKYIASVLGITPVSLSRIRKRIAEKKKK